MPFECGELNLNILIFYGLNELTAKVSIRSLGRAALYKMNAMLIAMPTKMPICTGNTMQATNAPSPGTRSVPERRKNIEQYA